MSKRNRHKNPVTKIMGSARQSVYPPEVRITSPDFEKDRVSIIRLVEDLIQTLRAKKTTISADEKTTQLIKAQSDALQKLERDYQQQIRLMIEICTGLWRVEQNVQISPGVEPNDKQRRANRHVNSLLDKVRESGFTIKDHTNEPYDSGMNLNVIAFDPRPGISREVIVETIKPTIFFNDHLLQIGDVIVASPEKTNNS